MRPIRIQKAEKNKKQGNRGWIYLLAFLVPVLIFTLGFALKGVYPFAGNFQSSLERERAGPGPHMPWDIIFTDCFAIISAVRSAS